MDESDRDAVRQALDEQDALIEALGRVAKALDEIADGTTSDRIGRYDLLRDWVHKVARAALDALPEGWDR